MLTVPEAARRLGRNPETIRRWIREGKLRSEKVGTQHLLREEDVATVATAGETELPRTWRTSDLGDAMPDWERLVRDGRSSH